jgi:integrase
MKVKVAVFEYLKSLERRGLRPGTLYVAEHVLTPFCEQFGDLDLAELTAVDVETFVARLPYGMHTKANHAGRIISLFKHHGINLKVHRPRFRVPDADCCDPADLQRFFVAAREKGIQTEVFFRVLLECGLRYQEARFLEWPDYNNGKMLTVRAKPQYDFAPKTHKPRHIPVGPDLARLLNQMPRHPWSPLIFPSMHGRPIGQWLKICKRIAQQAGLNPAKWSLHKFHRTCATDLLRRGLPLRDTMDVLGHVSIVSTQRYMAARAGDELWKAVMAVRGTAG